MDIFTNKMDIITIFKKSINAENILDEELVIDKLNNIPSYFKKPKQSSLNYRLVEI